jgi:serine/threonine-protein kinase
LKPDNLFLVRGADGSERVKIVDFGVAKLLHGAAETAPIDTGAAIGTPFYMAPEQARGDKNLDVRVDVYAVGVILYELLSGEKPHPGDSANAALAHVLTEPAASLDSLRAGLPPALVELVHRALSFEPKQRPESARALGQELESFLAPEVRRVRSQFELRIASTLADADTAQASPTPAAEPAQDSQSLAVAAASENVNGSSASRAKRVLLLAGVLGLAAFAWFRLSAPPSGDSEPRAEPSPAPGAFGSRNDTAAAITPSATRTSAAPPGPTAAEPLEPASKAPTDASPSAGSIGRPPGRPRSVRAADATAPAAPIGVTPSPPKSISTGVASGATSSNRVRFDAQNPYD